MSMITRSLSRWQSESNAWLGSVSNASTTGGRGSADETASILRYIYIIYNIYNIYILSAPIKPKHKPPMQQRTMSHVEQLRT
jgi:hypothetical protein